MNVYEDDIKVGEGDGWSESVDQVKVQLLDVVNT
jgi:hypothetical protein